MLLCFECCICDDYVDAMLKFDEALMIDPNKHNVLWCMGNANTSYAFLTPNTDEAKPYFEKAVDYFSQAVDAVNLLDEFFAVICVLSCLLCYSFDLFLWFCLFLVVLCYIYLTSRL